eukprot:TRINITY_DN17369_c0_g1_i1.p1 TRINITY_DN17369_c0_g1~~TRINITY_DN17369_c0_g1_i1.p1  ORF type:complete len:529 (+),score=119.33 TRINITY_DN17369_c0_g1_i1:81-1589(+)
MAQPIKTKLCRFIQEEGSCSRGDRCTYAHSTDELKAAAEQREQDALRGKKTKMCKWLKEENGCKRGDKCTWAHTKEELAAARPQQADTEEGRTQKLRKAVINDIDHLKVKKGLMSKAIKAVQDLCEKKSANTNPLFTETAESMSLYFTLTQIPEKSSFKPALIPLPHPMFDSNSEVCFFSKDPQKEYKQLLLEKHKGIGITRVIGLDKLKRNYKQLADKRALADAFDLFLCDHAVLEMMPKFLGSTFYRKKKMPIPVRMTKDVPERLAKAIASTTLRVPSGGCVGVRIGRVNMALEHLTANAAKVIASVIAYLSDNPVQSITVKSTESPALPVWRRARPEGKFLDLKKYRAKDDSSAASEAGESADASTVGTSDVEVISDAGETLSSRDTVSEPGSSVGADLSELDSAGESLSELDESAGDLDEEPAEIEEMPLVRGLIGKKRKRGGNADEKPKKAVSPLSSPKLPPKVSPKLASKETAAAAKDDKIAMPPPKKIKKQTAQA